MPNRYFVRVFLVAVSALSIWALAENRSASAAGVTELPAAGLPDLPAPRIELPVLPALPAPAPAPAPPLPLPSVPAPLPAPPGGARPAPANPVTSLPAQIVEGVAGAAESSAGGTAAPPPTGGNGSDARRRRRASRRSRPEDMPYRNRRRLVRALKGCLDRLPDRQSDALILRYGIGILAPRRARHAARALHVSVERFRHIHRRGMRNLVAAARRGSCEHGAVRAGTMASAYTAAWRGDGPVGGGATSSPQTGDAQETSAVLGVQRSGGEDAQSDGDGSAESAATALFGGMPATASALLIALLAVMLAGASWIILSFVRALR